MQRDEGLLTSDRDSSSANDSDMNQKKKSRVSKHGGNKSASRAALISSSKTAT